MTNISAALILNTTAILTRNEHDFAYTGNFASGNLANHIASNAPLLSAAT